MTIVIVVLHVMVCFLLIAVILLQAGRGQGLSGPSLAGGSTQSIFGTRAADFLAKATTVSALLFLVTCVSLDLIYSQRSRSLLEQASSPTETVSTEAFQKALEKLRGEGAGKEQASLENKTQEGTQAAQPQGASQEQAAQGPAQEGAGETPARMPSQ